MLETIDRLQIVTPDAKSAAEGWRRRLGAEVARSDSVRALGAKRTTLRVGTSEVELLEPDGAGIVADALTRRGRAHLFGAGAASADVPGVVARAVAAGARHFSENGQDFLRVEIDGARVNFVISPRREAPAIGHADFLYEVTLIVADPAATVGQLAQLFGLTPTHFVPISNSHFGYTGVLTLFSPDRLDRFEVITPTDPSKTLGRYYARTGASYYMAYAESGKVGEIERAARADGVGLTREPREAQPEGHDPEQIWLHPDALGGVMLGVSRPTLGWRWSGHPEWVEAIATEGEH